MNMLILAIGMYYTLLKWITPSTPPPLVSLLFSPFDNQINNLTCDQVAKNADEIGKFNFESQAKICMLQLGFKDFQNSMSILLNVYGYKQLSFFKAKSTNCWNVKIKNWPWVDFTRALWSVLPNDVQYVDRAVFCRMATIATLQEYVPKVFLPNKIYKLSYWSLGIFHHKQTMQTGVADLLCRKAGFNFPMMRVFYASVYPVHWCSLFKPLCHKLAQ